LKLPNLKHFNMEHEVTPSEIKIVVDNIKEDVGELKKTTGNFVSRESFALEVKIINTKLDNISTQNIAQLTILDKKTSDLEKKDSLLSDRLSVMEKQYLVIYTKIATYSAVAIFIGSIIATISFNLINKYL